MHFQGDLVASRPKHMVYVSAVEGPALAGDPQVKFTTHYFDERGNVLIRSGGSKAWRNNNPANMIHRPGGFAVRHGAIGKAGGMAIFSTEEIGHKALTALLKSPNYINLKIKEISERYDKDNMENHRRMLLSISKLDAEKQIKDLEFNEFKKLQEAIERIEGWQVGEEEFIEKWFIAGVHKKRGVIFEYLVKKHSDTRWISKIQAIELASRQHLHATLVHLKNGTVFLRPEYGTRPFVVT